MTDSLPTPVVEYFTRMDGADKRATIGVFAPDATVTDDGHTYAGRAAILGWLGAAASEYTVTTTRLTAERTAAGALVTVRLAGDFPGGVVDLRHDFTLTGSGLISALVIAP
jgi:hypothetical protein